MKLIALFMLTMLVHIHAASYGQKVSLNFKGASLTEVLDEIQKQTGYDFLYNSNLIDEDKKISLHVKGMDFKEVLRKAFNDQSLAFELDNKTVLIKANRLTSTAKEKNTTIIIQQNVRGKVYGENEEALEGVSITVEGTNIATSTDENGAYSINASKGQRLVFSFVGYNNVKRTVEETSVIDIVMQENLSALEEVVVVGFGTQKKESVVGAVQSVKPSQLKTTSSNLTTSFAGNIAGIIASQGTGEPGYDGASFYVRGISTFGANKSALIVLDGVEINGTMLNNIAPETIESFSILKDATATALYGSRGANGVIIINTKTGSNTEKMMINLRFDNTVSMPTFIQDVADGVTYMNAYNEAVKNSTPANQQYVPFYSADKIEGTRNKLNPYIYPDNDWYNMLFKDFSHNQNLSFNMSGGTKKIDYFLSTSIFNENGMIKKPADGKYENGINNKKFLFQSNVSSDLTKTTRIGLKMNTQLWYNDRPSENVTNLFYYTMRANPVRFPATLPAQEGDTYTRFGNNSSWDVGPIDLNPYALLSRGYENRYYSYLTTVINIDQDLKGITEGLKAKFLASFYNYTHSGTARNFVPFYFKVRDDYTVNDDGTYNYNTESIGNPGSTYLTSSVGRAGHREYAVQGTLDYLRKFGVHEVGAMGVFHMKEQVLNTPAAEENDILPFRQLGIAGRATYNYDSKYFTEVNFGYNGSENFITGSRFGFFPSVALGYLISNEGYFDNLRSTINTLKIRASYGLAGNDALNARFPYLTTVSMGGASGVVKGINFSGTSGPQIAIIGNPDATWEKAKKLNIGLDMSLLNSINLTFDVFSEKRTGIFMQRQSLPTSMGLSGTTPYANIGEVKNQGFDFTLEYKSSIGNDFRFSTALNFTYAHNEVLAKDEPKLLYPYMSEIGRPINALYGLISDKLFTSADDILNSPTQEFSNYNPGDIKYKDLNGDGKVDGNDITAYGYPTIPEIIYGLNVGMNYKKFDLNFLFQAADRVSLRMDNIHPFVDAGSFGFNASQWIIDDHWSEDNPNIDAAYPRLSSQWNVNNIQNSSFWVKDASYIRLKYMEAGYRINKVMRVYAAGTNLLTFSSFKYWDPEMGGGNGLKYPLQRTVKLGLQCNF